MRRRHTEKCYLYSNRKHGMYGVCSGIHVQYNSKCCVLYNLRVCLYSRNNLSIHGLYSDNESGMLSVFVMYRWNTEKCCMYCISKYCMYCLCSGIYIQYNNECCNLYSLYSLCCWYTDKCDLYNNR